MGSVSPCPFDRPSTARQGEGPERSAAGPRAKQQASRVFACRVSFVLLRHHDF